MYWLSFLSVNFVIPMFVSCKELGIHCSSSWVLDLFRLPVWFIFSGHFLIGNFSFDSFNLRKYVNIRGTARHYGIDLDVYNDWTLECYSWMLPFRDCCYVFLLYHELINRYFHFSLIKVAIKSNIVLLINDIKFIDLTIGSEMIDLIHAWEKWMLWFSADYQRV